MATMRGELGRAVTVVVAALLVIGVALGAYLVVSGDDDEGVEASGSTTTAPSGDGSSTTTTAATGAPDPAGVALSREGLGALRIGMTKAQAEATGMLGAFTPGCEVRMPRPEGAPLLAPYDGYVEVDGGVVTSITVHSGAATDPGGVRAGDRLDEATAAFEAAGLTVTVDEGTEEVFGVWFVSVTDESGDDVFGTTADPAADGALGPISTPYVQACE